MKIITTLSAALVVATTAGGQVPVPVVAAPPVVVDSVPVFERPNGALLRPGALTYALALTHADGQTTTLGTRTTTVSDAVLGGTAGWLIADARRGTALETSDSVYVMRADLTPERWTATIGTSQLGASFARDTMFGALATYRGRFSFAAAAPPGTLLSGGMVERVIELLPLRIGYRAGAYLMLVDSDRPQATLAEIVVDREDRVDTGSRRVDCWIVSLRAGALEQRLWVAKDGARVVRTEQAVASGMLTSTLLR